MKPGEYISLHFERVPEEQRKDFLTDKSRFWYYNLLNRRENQPIFLYKDISYQHFQKYYRRELKCFSTENQKEEFERFLETHTYHH